MKPIYIVLIALVSIGIAATVSFFGTSSSKYVGFAEAISLSKTEGKKEFHILGKVNHAKEVSYDAKSNRTIFYAIDSLNTECKIVYYNTKPADMDKADIRLLMIGYYDKDHFHCNEIRSKCPSKYEDSPVAGQK